MNIISKRLIERLSNYSQKLETQAMFVDKLWAVVDEDGHQQSYMFESNGELMMSKNGMVNMGTWHYYSQANSIRIDRGRNDQVLLNHGFLDEAVMVLKYDGANNDSLLVLADKNKIPDLNIVDYLRQLDYKNHQILSIKLNNGKLLLVENGWNKSDLRNLPVKTDNINGVNPNDGIYFDEGETYLYDIKDGKIVNRAVLKTYRNGIQKILIAQRITSDYYNGDLVFSEDLNPLPDGKYNVGIWKKIKVKKGRVIDA